MRETTLHIRYRLRARILLWFRVYVRERFFARRQYNKLALILGGHVFFEAIASALELDLFSVLSEEGPCTEEFIADRLGIERKPARALLLNCVALKLIRKRNAYYQNTRLAEDWLTANSPFDFVSITRWHHHIIYRPIHHFLDSIKKNANVGLQEIPGVGDTVYDRLSQHPELENIFHAAMASLSRPVIAQLVDILDFSRVGHVVDVGGGNGSNLIYLLKKFPKLHGTLYDTSSVSAYAMSALYKAGLLDRTRVQVGNCFTDELPRADCFLLVHFCTIWSEQENLTLLRKCHHALNAGGSIIILSQMQHDDQTGPLAAAVGAAYFLTLATGRGLIYSRKEYLHWLNDAGFSSIRSFQLSNHHQAIVATK